MAQQKKNPAKMTPDELEKFKAAQAKKGGKPSGNPFGKK